MRAARESELKSVLTPHREPDALAVVVVVVVVEVVVFDEEFGLSRLLRVTSEAVVTEDVKRDERDGRVLDDEGS